MNLTSTEIFKLVWDRIRDSLLGKTVPMMYADHYPNNPSGEFIVVGSLSNVVGDSQVATVNVNIYVPDTTPTIGREEQRYPDRNRLNELTRLAFDSLGYYPINERWFFDVSDETLISEEGISYTFSNLKVYNMKKEEVGRLTEQRALDTLTEKIESFEIEGNDKEQITLYLYPLQLGRLAMISRRLIDLDLIFDDEQMEGAVKRMWTICSEKSKEVAEIIAIATLRTQQEIEDMLKERTKLIYWSPTMDTTALTNILSTIVFQSYYADFMNAIRAYIIIYQASA